MISAQEACFRERHLERLSACSARLLELSAPGESVNQRCGHKCPHETTATLPRRAGSASAAVLRTDWCTAMLAFLGSCQAGIKHLPIELTAQEGERKEAGESRTRPRGLLSHAFPGDAQREAGSSPSGFTWASGLETSHETPAGQREAGRHLHTVPRLSPW